MEPIRKIHEKEWGQNGVHRFGFVAPIPTKRDQLQEMVRKWQNENKK
jgi:hypothetical protein